MSETEKDISARTEDVGMFKQAAPIPERVTRTAEEAKKDTMERIPQAAFAQLPVDQLFDKANAVLCWLARFPIQCNHPRQVSSTIKTAVAGEVMVVQWEEKIPRVFRKLVTEGFLSVPVLDKNKRFLYFIDMLDLVWHVCNSFDAWEVEAYPVGADRASKRQWAAYFDLPTFKNSKVDDVFGETKMQIPRLVTFEGFSTLSAIEAMVRTGQRRIVLLTPDEHVRGILTLSMVISSLDQHLEEFGQLQECTVDLVSKTCGIRRPLVTVRQGESAVAALKLMVTNNISSVPVVNEAGELVDVISVRDLRGIGPSAEHFERLWYPINLFKKAVREEFPMQTPSSPITVFKSDSFRALVRKMDDGNIHHVYIVEPVQSDTSAHVPVGVLSQADIVQFVLYQCGQQIQVA